MKNAVAVIYLLVSLGLAQVVFAGVVLYFNVILSESGVTEWVIAGIIAVVCAVGFLIGAMECGRKLVNRSPR